MRNLIGKPQTGPSVCPGTSNTLARLRTGRTYFLSIQQSYVLSQNVRFLRRTCQAMAPPQCGLWVEVSLQLRSLAVPLRRPGLAPRTVAEPGRAARLTCPTQDTSLEHEFLLHPRKLNLGVHRHNLRRDLEDTQRPYMRLTCYKCKFILIMKRATLVNQREKIHNDRILGCGDLQKYFL